VIEEALLTERRVSSAKRVERRGGEDGGGVNPLSRDERVASDGVRGPPSGLDDHDPDDQDEHQDDEVHGEAAAGDAHPGMADPEAAATAEASTSVAAAATVVTAAAPGARERVRGEESDRRGDGGAKSVEPWSHSRRVTRDFCTDFVGRRTSAQRWISCSGGTTLDRCVHLRH
jgi:hypothetical protein